MEMTDVQPQKTHHRCSTMNEVCRTAAEVIITANTVAALAGLVIATLVIFSLTPPTLTLLAVFISLAVTSVGGSTGLIATTIFLQIHNLSYRVGLDSFSPALVSVPELFLHLKSMPKQPLTHRLSFKLALETTVTEDYAIQYCQTTLCLQMLDSPMLQREFSRLGIQKATVVFQTNPTLQSCITIDLKNFRREST